MIIRYLFGLSSCSQNKHVFNTHVITTTRKWIPKFEISYEDDIRALERPLATPKMLRSAPPWSFEKGARNSFLVESMIRIHWSMLPLVSICVRVCLWRLLIWRGQSFIHYFEILYFTRRDQDRVHVHFENILSNAHWRVTHHRMRWDVFSC